jgi:hypothetical protein
VNENPQPEHIAPGGKWLVRLRTNMTPVAGNADAIERSSEEDVREYDLKPHEPEADNRSED